MRVMAVNAIGQSDLLLLTNPSLPEMKVMCQKHQEDQRPMTGIEPSLISHGISHSMMVDVLLKDISFR